MSNAVVKSPSNASLDLETACRIAVDQLWSALRAQVAANLGRSIGGGKSPSDLVQSALGSFVESSLEEGLQIDSEAALNGFLRSKVHEKIAAHVRYINSQKRDISREEAASEQMLTGKTSGGMTPEVKELVDGVMAILDAEPDLGWRRAYYLGIVELQSAPEIFNSVQTEFSDNQFGSVRNIQRRLVKMRNRIFSELG